MTGSDGNNASVVAPGGRLCRLDELADAASRPFWLTIDGGDAVEIFVVRQGDQVYSYVNSCPHHDRPLQREG